MKKKISFVHMDSSLELWLIEKLVKEAPKSDCAEDFLSGMQELLCGEVASLLLSAPDEEDVCAMALPDGMKLGELEIYPRSRRVAVQGTEVNLTPKEFDILYFLAQNRGEVFTKEPNLPRCLGRRLPFGRQQCDGVYSKAAQEN